MTRIGPDHIFARISEVTDAITNWLDQRAALLVPEVAEQWREIARAIRAGEWRLAKPPAMVVKIEEEFDWHKLVQAENESTQQFADRVRAEIIAAAEERTTREELFLQNLTTELSRMSHEGREKLEQLLLELKTR